MDLGQIEQNVAELDFGQGFDLIYDLLRAYGLPKASISRLRNGSHNRSDRDDERLWKGKLYYRFVQGGEDLHGLIDGAMSDARILKERPRFLIVRDDAHLLALDMKTRDTLDVPLSDLRSNTAFFLPWAGIEKTQLESLNYADIKAAEKMARLYDEIIRNNEFATDKDVHHLNVFFSRLLFCFFAEDTGVFDKGQFTNAVGSLTRADGEDVHIFLDTLFAVLNMEPSARSALPSHLRDFGYVNGNLFNQDSLSPFFSAKARRLVLECGALNWSQINPDIFGSMIQAVVHPSQRESLGMHYTSVENIMKVVRPLFLDSLHEEFDSIADNARKLRRLLDRVCAIKVFDPACGSGNFLVIAYKELRKLEHRILQRISELEFERIGEVDFRKVALFQLSGIKLENFYGIEVDDFAHEIAILSLWLAKHQMNVEFHELFGVEISLIPLRDTGNVVCGNAARLDWEIVCASEERDELYLLGNPPYLGARLQSSEQKADLQSVGDFGEMSNDLDYVSIWLLLGAKYVVKHGARLGFVATNSICQGEQVSLLWPAIYAAGADISFAVQSFRWSNSAKGSAGVTCVVVGLERRKADEKLLYSDGLCRSVHLITPYLTAGRTRVVVPSAQSAISERPTLTFGSMANDGGHLILSASERDYLVQQHPESERFIRRFLGAREFINGEERFALWIEDGDLEDAMAIPVVADRIRRVERYRSASKRSATKRLAARPHRFGEIRHKDTPSIIVPRHSSEKREYIPMGFLDWRTVISDAAMAIYDAEPWVFGIVQSRMHMVWVRTVGGRIKTDYRYSAELAYNTFPLPSLTSAHKTALTERALNVLDAEEQFADRTPAELYDPDRMPDALRRAHSRLDETVDQLYRVREFASNDERLELLFEMYDAAT